MNTGLQTNPVYAILTLSMKNDDDRRRPDMNRKQITRIVIISLFAALISAGSYIRIPLAPVPVVLSNFFVLLAASCLPPLLSLASIAAYLFIGACGLPVFTSGGGIAALLAPTGGYLFGMIPASIAGSLIMRILEKHIRLSSVISALVSTFFIYLAGIPWLAFQLDISLPAALLSGFVPFIPGDALKIVAASVVAPTLRPRIREMLERE